MQRDKDERESNYISREGEQKYGAVVKEGREARVQR